MQTKEMLMNAIEAQISLSRRALEKDVHLARVHYEHVKTLCEVIKLLDAYEVMLISELDDVD